MRREQRQGTRTSETSNLATANTSRALIPWAIDGEAFDTHQPIVLAAGVDTLYFSFDIEASEEMWTKLEEEQLIAQFLLQECKAVHCPPISQ